MGSSPQPQVPLLRALELCVGWGFPSATDWVMHNTPCQMQDRYEKEAGNHSDGDTSKQKKYFLWEVGAWLGKISAIRKHE
eukprot:1679133-Amphidinium_carterae.1